jgi:hypothetical protein
MSALGRKADIEGGRPYVRFVLFSDIVGFAGYVRHAVGLGRLTLSATDGL